MRKLIASLALAAALLTACSSAPDTVHGVVTEKEHHAAEVEAKLVPKCKATTSKGKTTKVCDKPGAKTKVTPERWELDIRQDDGTVVDDVEVSREEYDRLNVGDRR